jgi:hypothetical protein
MAVDLSKFNVPGGSTGVLVQPKLSYRFRVVFNNFGNGDTLELTSQVVSATRPSVTHDDITVDVYNSRIFLAGKHTWDPITVTVKDDVTGKVAMAIAYQMQKQVDHANQASAASGIGYKFGMTITNLDGGNGSEQPLDYWELAGCYIQNVNYGENNYSTSDPLNITIAIKFDNANHNVMGTEALAMGTVDSTTGPASGGTAPMA